MRELVVDIEYSTADTLFLRDAEGHEYSLPITEELRAHLRETSESAPSDPAPVPAPIALVQEVEEPQPEEPEDPEDSDPLYTNPLTLRPREIQERVRAGATAEQLAQEMNVAYSRVEPYAHPILVERSIIAELAKSAHPVREDGPAKLTLGEILGTAFGARGYNLAEATWDATKEVHEEWVITLRWKAGLTENQAEWTLRDHHSSNATAEPRNAIAADLIEPDFAQPVRTLSAVSRGVRPQPQAEAAVAEEHAEDTSQAASHNAGQDAVGDDFLRHPSPEQAPRARRRKATTPHWEDVLLGVRANTKRPRS